MLLKRSAAAQTSWGRRINFRRNQGFRWDRWRRICEDQGNEGLPLWMLRECLVQLPPAKRRDSGFGIREGMNGEAPKARRR